MDPPPPDAPEALLLLEAAAEAAEAMVPMASADVPAEAADAERWRFFPVTRMEGAHCVDLIPIGIGISQTIWTYDIHVVLLLFDNLRSKSFRNLSCISQKTVSYITEHVILKSSENHCHHCAHLE